MWTYKEITGGGYIAPLMRPDLVNPLLKAFLRMELCDDQVSPAHASRTRHPALQPPDPVDPGCRDGVGSGHWRPAGMNAGDGLQG